MSHNPESEVSRGLRSFLLKSAWFYELFQNLVVPKKRRQWLLANFYRINPVDIVVDVGCGPGKFRTLLPADIEYYGFDVSENYIDQAKSLHKGNFFKGNILEFSDVYSNTLRGKVDVVVCNGVLHHLSDDEINQVLKSCYSLLKEGGRMLFIEPCFFRFQDVISRNVLKRDRGMNIKYDFEWFRTITGTFPKTTFSISNRYIRIPYTHIMVEAVK